MSDIAPIGPGVTRVGEVTTGAAAEGRLAGRSEPTPRPSDRVELSDRARLLSKLIGLPDVRTDLVERVRSEIAAGTYETPERLEGALAGLIEDLDELA